MLIVDKNVRSKTQKLHIGGGSVGKGFVMHHEDLGWDPQCSCGKMKAGTGDPRDDHKPTSLVYKATDRDPVSNKVESEI